MLTPFRIIYPSGTIESSSKNQEKKYLERLVGLIPAEVISIYLFIRNTSDDLNDYQNWLPITCLILVIIVRIWGTKIKVPNNKIDIEWANVLISSISFIIWVYATGGQLFNHELIENKAIIAAAISIWSFIVPLIYKPKNS